MTKPTQDKETLREAVARAIAGSVVKVSVEQVDGELTEPVRMSLIENLAINYYPEADAAIATMFERLRTPSEGMIEAGCNWCKAEWDDEDCRTCLPDIFDVMLTAFQQENSDER